MSNIAKLLQQKEAIEKAIKEAEAQGKNREKFQKVLIKALEKTPKVLTTDLKTFEAEVTALFQRLTA